MIVVFVLARPVTVYRLIGKETIEENMFRAAEKKLQLEAEVVGEESTYASLQGPAKSKKGNEANHAKPRAGWMCDQRTNRLMNMASYRRVC